VEGPSKAIADGPWNAIALHADDTAAQADGTAV
jgi:hypothetical protein